MQTNPADEQNKNVKWSKSPWNPSGKKGFAEEPSLKFRMKDRMSTRRRKWW